MTVPRQDLVGVVLLEVSDRLPGQLVGVWRQVGLAGQDAQWRFDQALAGDFGRGQRQVEVKGGAGAGHAGEGDRAAVQPDQFVGDSQPQAEAFRGATAAAPP